MGDEASAIIEPCLCVRRGDGPEGCGLCNETGLRNRGPMRPLIFHREGVFYPIELPLYDDLSAHAESNPGTLKITDALTGEILWRPQ